jgi:hypothetical protein
MIRAAASSIVLLSLTPMPAWSATGAHAQQPGAALLGQIQSGQTSCGKLSSNDFVLMGEYDMERIMGSTAAYDAMDREMHATGGANSEQLADQFMGERLGDCATGNGPVAFGTMMGIMGTSEMGASYGSGYPSDRDRSSMMGDYGSDNSGVSVFAVAAIVFGAFVLTALIVWLVTRRIPRRPTRYRTT